MFQMKPVDRVLDGRRCVRRSSSNYRRVCYSSMDRKNALSSNCFKVGNLRSVGLNPVLNESLLSHLLGASSLVCSFKISPAVLMFVAICSSCTKCWSSPCDKFKHFFMVQGKVRLLAPCHLPAGEKRHEDGAVGGIPSLHQCLARWFV